MKVTLATQTIGSPSWYLPQVGFFVLECYSTNMIWKMTAWQNLIHQTNTSAYLLFAKNAMGKIEKTYCRVFWITQVSLQLKLRKRKVSTILLKCCPPLKWLCKAVHEDYRIAAVNSQRGIYLSSSHLRCWGGQQTQAGWEVESFFVYKHNLKLLVWACNNSKKLFCWNAGQFSTLCTE